MSCVIVLLRRFICFVNDGIHGGSSLVLHVLDTIAADGRLSLG